MWTDEKVAKLREWLAEGLSCSQVAARFGFTKNAVIGKASRLKIRSVAAANYRERAFRAKQIRIQKVKERAAREEARTAAKARLALRYPEGPKASVRPSVGLTEPSQDIATLIAIPTSNFMARKAGVCRWPHGDCEQKATNNSYCEKHHKRSRV